MLEYVIAIFVTVIIATIVIYSTIITSWKVKVLVTQSCPTLCNSTDCSPPGSPVHGILQARILEWVAISLSRGSSRLRDLIHVSCIGRRILYLWATREALSSFRFFFFNLYEFEKFDIFAIYLCWNLQSTLCYVCSLFKNSSLHSIISSS